MSHDWVRGHFVYHDSASYFVIPNLYSAAAEDGMDKARKETEAKWALAMNQLAGVLSDLDLVRWPARGLKRRVQESLDRWKSELQRLKDQEGYDSDTDLTGLHKKWNEEKRANGAKPEKIRNHGLFSKAERALEIAGWSDTARKDIEVFRLVYTEGLTPLLMVLSAREAA